MTTVRRIDELVSTRQSRKLFGEVGRFRADLPGDALDELAEHPAAVAALTLNKLNELMQQATPTAATVRGALLSHQLEDGSFGPVSVTAVAVRALLGSGDATARLRGEAGLTRLLSAQKPDGSFPLDWNDAAGNVLATAFVLMQLTRDRHARSTVRLEPAAAFLRDHLDSVGELEQTFIELALLRITPLLGQAAGLARPVARPTRPAAVAA